MKEIYRFRSIDKVISTEELDIKNLDGSLAKGRDELRKQQIFFSALDKLNDPMEGHKDIYWQGDEIAWNNFLRHYLMCLEQIFSLYLIGGEEFALSVEQIPIFKKYSDFPTPQYARNFQEICDLFFAHEHIKKCVQFFVSRKNPPIRKNELLLYLDSLHFYALQCISEIFYTKGLINNQGKFANFNLSKTVLTEQYFSTLNKLKEEHPDKPDVIETLSMASSHARSQLKLISQYNNDAISPNKRFFIEEFSSLYLKQIEKLLYPNSYIACFSKDYRNASMWSHYAGNHEGICFQFKLQTKEKMVLNGIIGISGDKTGTRDIMGDSSHHVHMVNYKNKFPEIDFFRSLGSLPIPHIWEVWGLDQQNKKSLCFEYLDSKNESAWRDEYWQRCMDILVTKTDDWSYEEEIRLVLCPTVIDGPKASTSMTYSFNELEGIIFGINTRQDYKTKIIKIIEDKCREIGRKDFKFYQAYYCSNSGKIEKAALSLLTFK